MTTVARRLPLSRQQTALYERARELGWAISRERGDRTRNERLHFTRPGRSLVAVFTHDGAFAYGSTSDPEIGAVELDLAATVRELESTGPRPAHTRLPPTAPARSRPDRRVPLLRAERPEETPPAESSTTAGISVPEPPELRKAWGPWPLAVIGLLVLCVLAFMVARIIA
ncbi:DUF6480 family protein [Kitasatospora sp. NPDC059571]|uniref:DUF6480 family protein n=1 Tax=Kitasatospora sp. NPDC059571 TaxID=3346871 RepID=UPI0036910F9F